MQQLLLAIVLMNAFLSDGAYAQTVMDQSDKSMDAKTVKEMLSAFTLKFPDPYAAQVIRLRQAKPGYADICGLVNTKNQYGAYTGFKPFRYLPPLKTFMLDEAAGCD